MRAYWDKMGGLLGQNGRLTGTKWAANSQAPAWPHLLTGTKWAANSQAQLVRFMGLDDHLLS